VCVPHNLSDQYKRLARGGKTSMLNGLLPNIRASNSVIHRRSRRNLSHTKVRQSLKTFLFRQQTTVQHELFQLRHLEILTYLRIKYNATLHCWHYFAAVLVFYFTVHFCTSHPYSLWVRQRSPLGRGGDF